MAKPFKPGGEKGKLHKELNIPVEQKIPVARLDAATRSSNPEIKRDAIRAQTMKGWNHSGSGNTVSRALAKHPAFRRGK